MVEEFDAFGFVEYREDLAIINISQRRLVSPKDGDSLKALVENAIKKGFKRIVVSFREVDFMSSAFLGTLVSISTRLRNIKGALKVMGLSPSIREIFLITNLDKLFSIQ